VDTAQLSSPSKEAFQIASRIWCDPKISDRIVDSDLTNVVAMEIDKLMCAIKEKDDMIAMLREEMNRPNHLF